MAEEVDSAVSEDAFPHATESMWHQKCYGDMAKRADLAQEPGQRTLLQPLQGQVSVSELNKSRWVYAPAF